MGTLEVLVSVVIELLTGLLNMQEMNLTSYSRNYVNELKRTFLRIQSMIKDADNKKFKTQDIQFLLEELKDAAYDMDDVLDEWITEMQIKSQLEELEMAAANSNKMMMMMMMKKKKKKVFSFLASSLCSCFPSSSLRVIFGLDNNIGSRIRAFDQNLDFIMRSYYWYDYDDDDDDDHEPPLKSTYPTIDISDICGRAIDKDIIMSRLLGESSSCSSNTVLSHPITVSIVGMGGIGKTTLAQLVFNDEKLKKHFEMTMWVCVSKAFDLSRITLEIIEQTGRSVLNPYEWNDLYYCVLQSVGNKRFLLVLDDVWNEDPNEWKLLMDALNNGAQGSRILVTTRNEGVAKVMNAIYTHYLGTLSDHDCWSILRGIAFAGREVEEQEGFHEIGFKIAGKCKGLPLAAKTLGELLRFQCTIRDWVPILKSEIWELEDLIIKLKRDFLIPNLLLSYYDLPSPLKGCFAHCSVFPKGHEMRKDVLIKLWMAQGFLNSAREGEELEMIGEEYFNSLVSHSFFQDLSKDENGNIISCKMHDLLHDLAHYIEKECYSAQYNTDILNYRSDIRHLSLICEDRVDLGSVHASVYNAKHLRSFQLLTNELKSSLGDFPASKIISNLKCLRVLCFSKIGLESLSSEVGELIHLRYLDLSGNCKLRELPESIANLYNLQTLELKGCRRLCKLPKEMGRMVNLRHLNIENTPSLSYLPQGFRKLTSLRTLSRFIVSESDKGCAIQELQDLNHLKGNIHIERLGIVKTIEDACNAKLSDKNLRCLILDFKCNDEGTDKDLETLMADRMEGVLAGLEPHPGLKEMEIRFYLGSKFPGWIVNISPILLPLLNSVVLQDCINCTELPDFGQLPSLETLIIHRLHNLKHLCFEFYSRDGRRGNFNTAFPKLKHLEICDMKSLEMWYLGHKEQVGDIMPCIQYVRLGCQKLQVFPALWKLTSLETLKIETTGDVKYIGPGFYCNAGRSVDGIVFPMLKHLEICDLKSLEVWDWRDGEEVGKIMPCLSYLKLSCQKLQAFPALWKLTSLETLKIETTGDVKHIGPGFYCNAGRSVDGTAFPMLKHLEICDLKSLEVWDLGDGEEVGKIMPCLSYLKLGCNRLKEFPALWKLPSLETLEIGTTGNVKHIGVIEFQGNYGICADRVAFPKLKELRISDMNLEEWDLGDGVVRQMMPCLRHIELDCPKLKKLPALGELQSLEILGITAEEIKNIGSEFYRNGCNEHATRVAFPNLKELYFRSMSSLEDWDLGEEKLIPCLHQLKLNCPNLKAWPALERLPSLEVLDIVLAEEETHIGCEFYGLSTGERFHSWYEKIGGMGLWRIRRRRNH